MRDTPRRRPGPAFLIRATHAACAALWLVHAATTATAAQVRDTARVSADTTDAVRLAPIVVTASRVPVAANRVGFPVTVVTLRDLELRRPLLAADALRGLDGVFVEEAAGSGGPVIVRVRGGEEVFTQILVDGVRVNQNGGYFDFQGLTLGGVERIEIARGPHSAMYGSSAVSGVVQFLSRRGEPGRVRASVAAEGSDATVEGGGYRGAAELSGGGSRVRWSASGGWTYGRGIYAVAHDTKTREASLRLDASPAKALQLDWVLRFAGVDAHLPVRDPGATRVPLDPNARNGRDRVITALTARLAGSARWQHQLRASFYGEDFVYADERDDVARPEHDFFVFDADFTLDSRLTRPVLDYSADVRFGDAEAGGTVTYGGSWERERLRDRTDGEFGASRQVLERTSGAGFAEVQLRPSRRLDVLAGVRVEKYEGLGAALTPRASAVIGLAPGAVSLRLAAGRSFKAPNLQEQYLDNPFIVSNPDLEPETSTGWEAGLDVRAGPRLSLGLTYFRQRYENLIRAVGLEDGTGRQQNRNLGASRAQGVEWRVEYRTGHWAAGTNGAWLKTEILDATGLAPGAFPEGEALPFRPSVVAGASLEMSVTDRVRAVVRADLVGSQTVLTERFSGRRVELDSRVLTGLTLNWDATTRWQLYARVDNLLDTQYETAYDRRGMPATAALGFRWRNR